MNSRDIRKIVKQVIILKRSGLHMPEIAGELKITLYSLFRRVRYSSLLRHCPDLIAPYYGSSNSKRSVIGLTKCDSCGRKESLYNPLTRFKSEFLCRDCLCIEDPEIKDNQLQIICSTMSNNQKCEYEES
jgi:hypothetical protein